MSKKSIVNLARDEGYSQDEFINELDKTYAAVMSGILDEKNNTFEQTTEFNDGEVIKVVVTKVIK